jgi:starvation-inducible outer membrane lipoprotein
MDAEQLAEVREATIVTLRANLVVTINDTDYHQLGVESGIIYLWDVNRPLRVDQQRTNFWDDSPPTTETILGRPLRDWALPDGAWRPFDLHPDTFSQWDHGCAVQMIHR